LYINRNKKLCLVGVARCGSIAPMTAIERAAYPRFKRILTAKDLDLWNGPKIKMRAAPFPEENDGLYWCKRWRKPSQIELAAWRYSLVPLAISQVAKWRCSFLCSFAYSFVRIGAILVLIPTCVGVVSI